MRKQLLILAVLSFLASLLTGCEVVKSGKFTRGTLGVNSKVKDLIIVAKPDGTQILILHGLNQNESQSAESISRGAVSALTKLAL